MAVFIDRLGQPCARTDKIGSETELEREQWFRFAAISYFCNKLCRGLHSSVFPPFFPFVFVHRRWRRRRRRRGGSWFLPWQKVAKRDMTRCRQIFEEPCRLLQGIKTWMIDKSAVWRYKVKKSVTDLHNIRFINQIFYEIVFFLFFLDLSERKYTALININRNIFIFIFF